MTRLLALLLLTATAAIAHDGEAPPRNTIPAPADAAGAPAEAILRPRQAAGQGLPLAPSRHLRFATTSGTWMSLDVTRDGRRILFDLLGDLYSMDAKGGEARAITGGLAFDTQPTVSPDGRLIAYVSDRSGADNLWLARPDGSAARQLSFGEDDTVLVSPAWASDGRALYVSRYRPDLNNYELWRYGLDGAETLVVAIRDAADTPRERWRSTLGTVASPDGRALYYARHEGGIDVEGVDEWTIVRHDLASGAETMIVSEPGGAGKARNPGAAFRPALSPDGRLLAYAHRVENATELRLRDLATGADRRIAFPIEHDQLQASMWQDALPRYAFTPTGDALLLSRAGGFERISLADGAATTLPFRADVDLALGASTRQRIREPDGPVRARLIMAPAPSPDGRTLAFSALGRLWTMPLDRDAALIPFANGGDPAFQPSWSPDGRRLVWVTWTERGGGAVWSAPADGTAPPRRLTTIPAFYTYPVFTPDGRNIVVLRSAQADRLRLYMEYGKLRASELVELPAAGGEARVVTRGTLGSRPHFAADPNVAYLLADDGLDSVDLRTGARRAVLLAKGPGWYFQDGPVPVDDLRVSPDGRWLLAEVAQQLHLVAMPTAGTAVLDLSRPGLPHRRITAGGVDYFEWMDGGRLIGWSTGATFHMRALSAVTLDPADRDGWTADTGATTDRHALIEVPRDRPAASLLLTGARVLTMAEGDRVIDYADILVTGGHIASVGAHGSVAVPAGTAVRDMTGRTILPGFIDTHDHIAEIRREVLGFEDWGLRARLAFGVTTSFDPSTLSIDMLAYQDLLDAGLMVGPRLRQTGIALFSMQRFASLDEVRAVLRRYRDDYGLANIKEYRTGDRRMRQWVAIAARELGLQPTTEGALAMKLDLGQILDGFAANEHALVAAPLGDDVVRLMAETRTGYTTTLQITNGGPPGQDWFIAQDDPHDNARLRRFWPDVVTDQVMLARPWRRLAEYRFPAIAADAARIQRARGVVGIGAHGEMPGIGFHYELEAHVLGGMTPLEALHASTIGSAEHIGRAADLGSIEAGKLADLVILADDPRADIRKAREPVQVMRDGRLYDAATLDELWPVARTLSPSRQDDLRHYLPQGGPTR